jgi:polar amino acid transport system substrate-binding protein
MPDAPPLTFVSFQGGYGMVGDVALAAIARAGYLSHIHVTPWARPSSGSAVATIC